MSEVEPYRFHAPLTVCVDFKHPGSYLAKDPTYALADELGLAVDWLPFTVAPIPEPVAATPDDDRGTRHKRFRSLYFEQDLARYAAARGLTLGNIYRNPDTSRANAGLLFLKVQGDAVVRRYLDAVFERYWNETLDIENATALCAIAEEIGADSAGLEAALEGSAHAAVQAQLAEAGIFNVPGFVVEEEIYYGREHLPMIRWLLTGKEGPGPI